MTEPATEELPAGTIGLKLSNHLTWKGTDYVPGDVLPVTRDEARGIIAAGYAAVDPEDTEAVREALQLDSTEPLPDGTVVDYGAVGQGVGQLHTGPPLAPEVTGAAAEAGLAAREGRAEVPDESWHVAELRGLAHARGLEVGGTKAHLLERVGKPARDNDQDEDSQTE